MENPLLTETGLPPFSHNEVSHVEPAIDTVLGTREPMEMFVPFRGREPRIAPLLRRWGLAT